jgi:hypothetical protein
MIAARRGMGRPVVKLQVSLVLSVLATYNRNSFNAHCDYRRCA